jgi:hypothetical protein
MPTVKANLIRVLVTTTGTGGPLAIGAAVSNFRALSNVPDGSVIDYALSDTVGNETGWGVVSGGGTAVTRNFIDSSTGSALNLSGAAQLIVTALARDFSEEAEFAHAFLGGI